MTRSATEPASARLGAAAPEVSVVIVSYNVRELLEECLASLADAAGGRSIEVIVVDNASSDGSAALVARDFPEVVLIESAENLGFARANNLAFERARGRYVYCLNPDTISRPGSIDALVRVLEGDPRIGYVGPKLLNADGTHQLSAYRFHRLLSGFVSWSMLGLDGRLPHSRHSLSLHHAYGADERIQAEWLLGAAILVPREAIDATGGFDESYFLYAEEVDWCARIHAAGWFGCYEPAAVVVHVRAASTSHLDHTSAFNGHDPRHLVESHRRLARRSFGIVGLAISQALHVAGVSIALARNLPGLPDASADKRRKAALWIRYLLVPSSFRRIPRSKAGAST